MTKLKLTRQQLAQFLKNHESIKEFENLFNNSNDFTTLIENIIDAVDLNNDGTYKGRTGTNYLDASTAIYEDSTLLDIALFNNVRELIVSISSSTTLSATSQIVLSDATAGAINITLPPPADCFSDSRSLKIGISKIDTTANIVTILPNASESIVGEASQSINSEGDILNFITDGTNWYLQN